MGGRKGQRYDPRPVDARCPARPRATWAKGPERDLLGAASAQPGPSQRLGGGQLASLGRVQGSPWPLPPPGSQGSMNSLLWPLNRPFINSRLSVPLAGWRPSLRAQKTKKLPREAQGCPDEALGWRSTGQTGPHVSNPTRQAGPPLQPKGSTGSQGRQGGRVRRTHHLPGPLLLQEKVEPPSPDEPGPTDSPSSLRCGPPCCSPSLRP